MLNEQSLKNLQPKDLSQYPNHKEISSKGGRAKTLAKKMAYFNKKKCANCKLPCPLRDEGAKEHWKCKIPDTKRLILEASIFPEKLTDSLFADAMQLQTLAGTDFKKLKESFYAKLNLKKEINPTPQFIGLQGNIQIEIIEKDA